MAEHADELRERLLKIKRAAAAQSRDQDSDQPLTKGEYYKGQAAILGLLAEVTDLVQH